MTARRREAAPGEARAGDARAGDVLAGPEAAAGLALDRAPCGTLDLAFRPPGDIAHVHDPLWKDVSCVAVWGRTVFCSCDETSSVERLFLDPDTGVAGGHESFALGDAFALPEGRAGEMDIEGLAVSDGWLWVCGSHALKRDDPDGDGPEGLAAMRDIDWDANRAFLGRVPLVDDGSGFAEPMIEVAALGDAPARTSRMLRMRRKASRAPLRRMLARDPLIGPFVGLPCKENGLDIEGLAVRGDTVLLGLRGPVLGGLAFVVRLEMERKGADRLKPRRLPGGTSDGTSDGGGDGTRDGGSDRGGDRGGGKAPRYALHALDLNGQGVRDLAWHGDRLLVLSGATTDVEGLQSVFAVEGFGPGRAVWRGDQPRRVLDLRVVRGADHAEGIDVLPTEDGDRLVVTYDSPHAERTEGENMLTADLFEIGAAPGRG